MDYSNNFGYTKNMTNLFGKNLRSLRLEHELYQQDIADEFGVSPSMVSLWEKGANHPDLNTIIKISEFFNVTMDFLAGIEPRTSEMQKLDKQSQQLLTDFNTLTKDQQNLINELIAQLNKK